MDSSRRAVESYWRSRMVDAATSNEDKVAPVYKLEELCELLRSSHASIVKEISEFVVKRLDHKSPIVKQKALRLIKYAVGKSGVEFRREMQRHSVAVRQLVHYKGQPDPLKGDALNKAVRDMAQEALAAIFNDQENKPAPAESGNRRIEGFGNSNVRMLSEDKKSFLSEVVGLGSASIKQGLSSFTQSHSFGKNDNGSYKSPNLHRSLTIESDNSNMYEPVRIHGENSNTFGISNSQPGGSSKLDSRGAKTELVTGDSSSNHTEKTREERLLDTIVTSGGVRLQPTRDAIQAFLVEAAKLDAVALSWALESKLQSPQWQVRMKALCVLDSILRKKNDEHFSVTASYFCENVDVLMRCSESPQASLRDKSMKVLGLLDREQAIGTGADAHKFVKSETDNVIQMPDLIDTGDPDEPGRANDYSGKQSEQKTGNLTSHTGLLIDDLLGDDMGSGGNTSDIKTNDDPFADVLFHTVKGGEPADDIFAGMSVSDKNDVKGDPTRANGYGSELIDIFQPSSGDSQGNENCVNDIMAGLSINGNGSNIQENATISGAALLDVMSVSESYPAHQSSNGAVSNVLNSQNTVMGGNLMFPSNGMPNNVPPGMLFNMPSQSLGYSNMANMFVAQQQYLATMSNLQHLGNLNSQNGGIAYVAGDKGSHPSPFPDIFQPNFLNQAPTTVMNNTKKEDTRAFDFISDHLAASRDPKRVV
ncbi:protein MODIFIED TRANSPORT TO THE VACUOLE 1-like [Rhodamnia argentea]|uniref:Protein MODIFIED TRANSPORT TO THE VACUOLE 1-like n=1 Tax=Rhodamnia argentea TaxID=178133 RepID=A0A8B8NVJ9_9MYRT|nr:protein MODIFIED TRANSPORT TO THE VACUOLE 1-like [Rhodamnia argentea]